jgi:hypothetical protein
MKNSAWNIGPGSKIPDVEKICQIEAKIKLDDL